MRLIDADAMNEELFYKQVGGKDSLITAESAFEMINSQPTAYDVDKVVEQLKEVEKIMKSPVTEDCFGEECRASDCTVCLTSKAIEIVKGGGVDGQDG
jgi:hypothetical protein